MSTTLRVDFSLHCVIPLFHPGQRLSLTARMGGGQELKIEALTPLFVYKTSTNISDYLSFFIA
ncbi:MAG TPA: hypothetical protein ENI34_03380 [candidate division WOR-3 bacterium]|uniref:Uncharacterized protein n=1 Tax=candidate division WOR-3 bacterium TaxID=2052148 RepID=A0A9C9EL97_UNCW3|nr:hypothetical protein [candidate division WOR-3 bacterium]